MASGSAEKYRFGRVPVKAEQARFGRIVISRPGVRRAYNQKLIWYFCDIAARILVDSF